MNHDRKGDNMSIRFWELFEQSVIVQSIITLMLVGAVVYMYVADHPVPDTLVNMCLLVLGFWFGTKVQGSVNQNQARKVISEVMEYGRRPGE